MPRITDLLPDAQRLLALAPADLAPYVLEAAKSQMQNGSIHEGNGILYGMFKGMVGAENNLNAYPPERHEEIELAVSEAFSWLKANQLLVPAPGTNGANGWLRLSRRARELTAPESDDREPEIVQLSGRVGVGSSGRGTLEISDTPLPLRGDTLPTTGRIELNSDPPIAEAGLAAPNFRLPTDWVVQQREILRRLDQLEALMREALPVAQVADEVRRRIGGNFPPVSLDGEAQPPGSASDVAAGLRAIGDLRTQLGLAQPTDPVLILVLARAVQAASAAVVRGLLWLQENRGKFALGVLQGVGVGIGKGGWELATHPEQVADLIHKIQHIGGDVVGAVLGLFI